MEPSRKRGERPVKEVREAVLALLRDTQDSAALRQDLERLSREITFCGLTHVWGPLLYDRSPTVFRSFIMRHFSSYLTEKGWRYKFVPWKGEVGKRLQAWMDKVDKDDEVELFRRLYTWKVHNQSHKKAGAAWRKDLMSRFRQASDDRERQTALAKMQLWFWLDEETSVFLYQTSPELAGPFILRQLPRTYSLFTGEKRSLWKNLAGLAKKNGDDEFYFKLYREQIPLKDWRAEVLDLARSDMDAEVLLQALRDRHPNTWNKDLGGVFADLLEIRGEELFPYILPELRKVLRGWFRTGFERLSALAEDKGWLELWAGLLRTCSKPKEYDKAVMAILKPSDAEAKKRLRLIAGVGQEWNFGNFGFASINHLSDKLAVAIYQKYPELVRGPLKSQISPNWNETYPKLIDLLLEHQDTEMTDYLASRLVTRSGNWGEDKLLKPAERLAKHYEGLQSDSKVFALRAARVLGQVPPYVVWNYKDIIRKNRLARLLYERSSGFYLQEPRAIQELIEATEIHAQILAYKTLALDRDEARSLARDNVQLLMGTLLRPLHRKTRIAAFKALRNAASDLELARLVLERARMANDLPDIRYPKDELVGLIAYILASWPELRSPEEQPIVYGEVAH